MKITPKYTNPVLNDFNDAQKKMTSSLEGMIDERNNLITDINVSLPEKKKLIDEIDELRKKKAGLNFANDDLTKGMKVNLKKFSIQRQVEEENLKKEIETFDLERKSEEQRLAELSDVLKTKETLIDKKSDKLVSLNNDQQELIKATQIKEMALAKERVYLKERESNLIESNKDLDALARELINKRTTFDKKEKILDEKEKDLKNKLDQVESLLTNKTSELKLATEKLEARDKQFSSKFKRLKEMETELKKKEIRINDRENISKLNTPR